ncbi:MAG: threonine/serine ThrE exporter family protein [Pseudomarimonas sp.]
MTDASFADRIDFVCQLARRLHAYGTTAQRLEGAICAVSTRLQLVCDPWSNPTGLLLSFADGRTGRDGVETTRVIRLQPGDIDLRKLCQADDIAERVLRGEIGLAEGSRALQALDVAPGQRGRWLMAFSFGLTSASVATLLHTGWAAIITAACVGWLIGGLALLGADRPRLAEALDALSAMVATLVVLAVAHYVVPLAVQSVVMAALIVLLPGLSLTNAVSELSSQHLVSGTARFAGAMATLLKLTFGTVAGTQIAHLLGWVAVEPLPAAQPMMLEWVALLVGSYAFAVLFRADRRDYLLVMASAWLGYLTTRYAGAALGSEAGVFIAGIVVGAVSNLYARSFNRPGALVRVPGIILLVPGSVGFRSLNFALERDVLLSLDTGFALIALLISLVAGLLFGNLLIPARRNL